MCKYTAISFAPVQGFIEKSRKLRDLYGASLILSFLSAQLVDEARTTGLKVVSPGLPNEKKGMPNRILIEGKLDPQAAENRLLREWQRILRICREWVEENLDIPEDRYEWSQKEEEIGKRKREWERWGSCTWEFFWGHGESIKEAMENLETRKLKRAWTAINWMGESSSLSGTDAIAWHQLGRILEKDEDPGRSLNEEEQRELKRFYQRLAWVLDDPDRRNQKARRAMLSDAELEEYFRLDEDGEPSGGKFIAPNERLSIPELVKRLATYDRLADKIGIDRLKGKKEDPEFKDIVRKPGYWTGWFMGDGDKIGKILKGFADRSEDTDEQRESNLELFTELMRGWGKDFEAKEDLFPEGKGRVIYAGGDDFLGVLYSEEKEGENKLPKIEPIEAFHWLLKLPTCWEKLQQKVHDSLKVKLTYSVGFVWAAHRVPQRDILQHCRAAEKRSKSLGRDRVTIRVVFNSGQYVQWTCLWDHLDILTKYRDRNHINTQEEIAKGSDKRANWNHIYSDWETLKARHAIQLDRNNPQNKPSKEIALSIFNLYFDDSGKTFEEERKWQDLAGDNSPLVIMNWLNDLIQVGWQLCRNSNHSTL